MSLNTYLLFLFIEVIDDDSNEEIEGEEGAKDDEEDKVDVHVDVDLPDGLFSNLPGGSVSLVASPLTIGFYNVLYIRTSRACWSVHSPSPPPNEFPPPPRSSPSRSCKVSTHLPTVDSPRHDVKPALEDGHLQQGEVGLTHVVEGHRGQGPGCGLL